MPESLPPRTTIYLDRTIDSSHVIPGHPGKCGRLHGHTYRFEVWIRGVVTQGSALLIDFYDVKSIIDEWDHQHLNDVVDFVPTAELLAAEMRSRIIAAISRDGESIDVIQCRVRLWETPSCYAEVGDIG